MATQRERILTLALELMAGSGAASMSMRDLADAAGMNVATLYHYFPSKRDLLTAVLEEPQYRDVLSGELARPTSEDPAAAVATLLAESWEAMSAVEDYVRVMLGEAMRGDDAARAVGAQLLATTEESLRTWAQQVLGADTRSSGVIARLLRAVIIGVFIEELAHEERPHPQAFRRRGRELSRAIVALSGATRT